LKHCTESPDKLEDFLDSVKDFAEDAKQAAKLATEVREAFTLWGHMVGELHAATENQQGNTSIERGATAVAEKMATIDKTFAEKAAENAVEGVKFAKTQVEKAEKRLGKCLLSSCI
jgi:hypothetical protein